MRRVAVTGVVRNRGLIALVLAQVCELPTECHVCRITLMSSPHLARSYHHLFPVPPYDELQVRPRPPLALRPPSSGLRACCER